MASSSIASNIFSTSLRILGGLVSVIAILVLAFYMVVEKKAFEEFLETILPSEQKKQIVSLIKKVQKRIGSWFLGQISLMIIVGIAVLIGLSILKVKYALVLALIAGVFEIVPVIGPIVAGIIAIIIAFGQSPILALLVFLLYVGIQQIENHILVPKVMQKAVGLNPVVILVALLIGAKLYGITGAILAIPVTAALATIIEGINKT